MVSEAPSARSLWRTIAWAVAAVALLALALWLRLAGLAGSPGYDEGVNGGQLWLLSTGHSLYREIFSTQGPLFLLSLWPFFEMGGRTLEAARLGSVWWSVLGLTGAFLGGWQAGGRLGGLASLAVLALSPMYLAQSRVIQSEAAALGPALLAVAAALRYHVTGRLTWLLLGSALLTLSLLIKPLTVAAGAVMLAAVLARPSTAVRHLAASAAVGLALVAGVVLTLGPREVGEQLIQFHTAAKTTVPLSLERNLTILSRNVQDERPLLLLAAVLGALGFMGRHWRMGLILGAWTVVTAAMLLLHTPLFGHHVAALIPPFAFLAAGLGPLVARFRGPLQGVAVGIVLFATGGWLSGQGGPALLSLREGFPIQGVLKEASEVLQRLTTPDDYVLTDHPALALGAQRQGVPELADLSRVRVSAGMLSSEQALGIMEQRRPRVAALWFEYLAADMPRLVDTIKDTYSPVWAIEGNRYLAVAGDGLDLPPEHFQQLSEARNPNFGGGLRLTHLRHLNLLAPGRKLELVLLWHLSAPLQEDYALLLTARSTRGPEEVVKLVPLGSGWRPTSRWRAPGRMATHAEVNLPPDLPPGRYRLLAELHAPSGRLESQLRSRPGNAGQISAFDVE